MGWVRVAQLRARCTKGAAAATKAAEAEAARLRDELALKYRAVDKSVNEVLSQLMEAKARLAK